MLFAGSLLFKEKSRIARIGLSLLILIWERNLLD
jgi:hypothetical protein